MIAEGVFVQEVTADSPADQDGRLAVTLCDRI
jgi:hypothetical protein